MKRHNFRQFRGPYIGVLEPSWRIAGNAVVLLFSLFDFRGVVHGGVLSEFL